MPNHLHIILPRDQKNAFQKLGGLLGAVAKKTQIPLLWQAIPPPREVPDLFHLQRQVRYIALNPCRKRLCQDPLEWYWSTYREVMGATSERQNCAIRLAQATGQIPRDFEVRFHAYVSSDPSVHVEGTPFPQTAVPATWAEAPIREILAASAASLRVSPMDIEKKGPLRALFVHMAYRHGWQQPRLLANICKMSLRGIHHILKSVAPLPAAIRAADLCLGDARLRTFLLKK